MYELMGLPVLVLFLVGTLTWEASWLSKLLLILIFFFAVGAVRYSWDPAWIAVAVAFLLAMMLKSAFHKITGSDI